MNSFLEALRTEGPAPDRATGLDLYAFLIGSCLMTPPTIRPGKPVRATRGEINAAWVLQGRAIQDVWRVPDRDRARDSFRWTGEAYSDCQSWTLLADFRATRIT